MDTLGVSFSPMDQDRMKTGTGGQTGDAGGSVNPIQEAIQTLSYRLPRQTGAQGLAPQQLMAGPGSAGLAGMPNNGVQLGLEQLLRMLFGGQMGMAPMAPTPNITPGVNPPGAGPVMPSGPRMGPEAGATSPDRMFGSGPIAGSM